MTLPRFSLAALQPLGRSLMLPIAVLPVAGMLLRLGQSDMLNIPFVAAAGDAIFHNLGLLFAIGVAVGFARDGAGAAGLAGVVCFLVATQGAQALVSVPAGELAGLAGKSRDLALAAFRSGALDKLSVPLGILSGLIAGDFYNRFGTIRLPDYLAFFGGRRFVPIVAGLGGLVLALVFGLGWTTLSGAIDTASRAIFAAGPLGLFVYGVLNRLLIVTGLHHILNNIAWFILGDYHGVTGDLHRFFAGDPSAGAFMAGFFPVMMFGLPGACLAMFHAAKAERRAEVGGLFLSLALTAMLTGVTEPIEFTFMFLAPALFALHAVMTGAAMVIMDALHVKLGFGFSAGLFDYVLNFNRATRPLWLIPVGAAYFALYYAVFRWVIVRFDLKTPGREEAGGAAAPAATAVGDKPRAYIEALGGAANLASVEACTTRLRLVVADAAAVDDGRLRALGALGVVRPGPRDIQVVVGPTADSLAREMRQAMAGGSPAEGLAERLLAALGGKANVTGVAAVSSRLRLTVASDAAVDEKALGALGVRGVARPVPGAVQVVLGPSTEAVATAVGALLA
jgi:PTS system N-acetylglucosamine-specific IIC component